MKKYIILLLVIALFSGCATVFGGGKGRIKVKGGEPANAKVFFNGNYMGDAPCSFKIPKNAIDRSTVEIKAEGYKTVSIQLTKKSQVGYVVVDILTGVVWVGIDYITGAIKKPYPRKIKYHLEKE